MSTRSVYSDAVIDVIDAITASAAAGETMHVALHTGTPAPPPVPKHWQYAGRFGDYLVWDADDNVRHVSRRADDFYAEMTGVMTESEIIAW